MFKEYFFIALNNIRARALRSWLTIIGIVIGIFLVVSLISLSEGMKQAVVGELRGIGTDVIMIMPGDMSDFVTMFMGGLDLSDNDIRTISRTEGVETTIPQAYRAEVVRHENESKTMLIYGTPFDSLSFLEKDMGWTIVDGRWPIPGRKEVIAGNYVPEGILPELEPGNTVTIKGRSFVVAGVLRSLGNRQDDSMITMDLGDYRAVTGYREGAQMVAVVVRDGFDVEIVAENIKTSLEETRKRTRSSESADVTVLTMDAAMDMIENVMGVIQMVILAFASIALIVGGIGIMNTMFTAVRERTKEIGILKAVGAKRKAITSIFLIESGIIGLIGGLGGVFFGILAAKAVELYGQFHPVLYITAEVSPALILFGLAFSFVVGSAAGFFPARRAAQMNVVDALRYE